MMASSSSPAKPELIVVSGPSCAGKTSVSRRLADQLDGRVLEAIQVLAEQVGEEVLTRPQFQAAGVQLEGETRGRWLAAAAPEAMERGQPLVVDSARTLSQVEALRDLRPEGRYHVPLTADPATRASRYEARRDVRQSDRSMEFEELAADPLEQAADNLKLKADLVVDTSDASLDDVVERVLKAL
jgi:adenylate kinase family enzyme